MKVTLRYLDKSIEVDTNLLLHIEFALADGKTFKVGVNEIHDAQPRLYLHCDGQLIIHPAASNRVRFDEKKF